MQKEKFFRKRPHMYLKGGFSLVELMIAIAIISILATVMLRGFSSWSTAHKIEADTDALFSFFQDARLLAFSEKRALSINIINGGKGFQLIDSTTGNAIGRDLTVETAFTDDGTAPSFTNRGIVDTSHLRYTGAEDRASYDCINFAFNRIRRGQYDSAQATPCVVK